MKDYSTYTLRALEVERQRQGKALVTETAASSRQQRTPNYEPILDIINKVEEILKKRAGTAVRSCLTKKRQREFGLLPQLTLKEI